MADGQQLRRVRVIIVATFLALQFGNYNVVQCFERITTIPALGRTSELGNLYDERSAKFTQDYISTSKQSILSHITTEAASSTIQKTGAIHNFLDKLKFFEFDLSTAVNLVSGLVQPHGSTVMLNMKNQTNKNEISGLFMMTYATVQESLLLFDPGFKPLIAPGSLNNSGSTHVVTGIRWGWRNMITFTSSKIDSAVRNSSILLDYFEKLSNPLQNSSEILTEDSNFIMAAYCDFPPSYTLLNNLSQAHELLRRMPPSPPQLHETRGVPLEYTLTPLHTLREYLDEGTSTGAVSYPISDLLLRDVINTMNEITSVEQQITKVNTKLTSQPRCIDPSSLDELSSLKTSFENNVSQLLSKLNLVLIQVRSGELRSHNLLDLLETYRESEFSHSRVLFLLEKFNKLQKRVKFCSNLHSFHSDIEYIGYGQDLEWHSLPSNQTIYVLYKKDEFVQNRKSAWKENLHTFINVLEKPYNSRLIIDCDLADATECHGINMTTLRQIKNGIVSIENVLDKLHTEICLPSGQSVLNLCELNECRNGASCKLSPDYTDFLCTCRSGFAGRMCETKVKECWKDGISCSNKGDCGTWNKTSINHGCHCFAGYEGEYCHINTDDCPPAACSNGGTCIDGLGSFTCSCPAGFEGVTCETNIDDCRGSSPCLNGGICHDKINSYYCECAAGYEGLACEIDTDDCAGIDKCLHDGSCMDQVNSYTCSCSLGYSGQYCEINVDDCIGYTRCFNGGICIDGINDYSCFCPAGYSGPNCETNVNDCAQGTKCYNGGTCVDVDGPLAFTCFCPAGFTGTTCEVDINECGNNGRCYNGGTCLDAVNSYSCNCAVGFSGSNCEVNVDDCAGSNKCSHGGTCIDEIRGYSCICQEGYTGRHCTVDVNECVGNNRCYNGGTCIDGVNSYSCACAKGFSGRNCETNIDYCAGSIKCNNGGTCLDNIDGYSCFCPAGYTGNHCGTPVDDCVGNYRCYNGGTCIDGDNSYRCNCVVGFMGRNCEINIDDCAGRGQCSNGGTCIDGVRGIQCHCAAGYSGPRCQTNIDDCIGNTRCYNGGTCVDGVNSYRCTCATGFSGKNCEVNIDDCAGRAKCSNGGTCIDIVNSFKCYCAAGYTGARCEANVNDCAGNSRCYNGGTCRDGVNSYSCSCPQGFTGFNCERNIDNCAGQNHCLNDGTCIDKINGYTCICGPEYTGRRCDTKRT